MDKKRFVDYRNIYCGFDDSNHASLNPKNEIIVGVFSENPDDFIVRHRYSRRNIEKVLNSLEGPNRTYLFTQLPKNKMFNHHFNLPLVAPFLFQEYLNRFPGDKSPNCVTLGFDGEIYKRWENVLKKDFLREYDLEVKIENFTEKNKKICPFPVYAADTISNWLFRSSFEDVVTEHDEMINIPFEVLVERYKLFK